MGTRVVFPAPGGACSHRRGPSGQHGPEAWGTDRTGGGARGGGAVPSRSGRGCLIRGGSGPSPRVEFQKGAPCGVEPRSAGSTMPSKRSPVGRSSSARCPPGRRAGSGRGGGAASTDGWAPRHPAAVTCRSHPQGGRGVPLFSAGSTSASLQPHPDGGPVLRGLQGSALPFHHHISGSPAPHPRTRPFRQLGFQRSEVRGQQAEVPSGWLIPGLRVVRHVRAPRPRSPHPRRAIGHPGLHLRPRSTSSSTPPVSHGSPHPLRPPRCLRASGFAPTLPAPTPTRCRPDQRLPLLPESPQHLPPGCRQGRPHTGQGPRAGDSIPRIGPGDPGAIAVWDCSGSPRPAASRSHSTVEAPNLPVTSAASARTGQERVRSGSERSPGGRGGAPVPGPEPSPFRDRRLPATTADPPASRTTASASTARTRYSVRILGARSFPRLSLLVPGEEGSPGEGGAGSPSGPSLRQSSRAPAGPVAVPFLPAPGAPSGRGSPHPLESRGILPGAELATGGGGPASDPESQPSSSGQRSSGVRPWTRRRTSFPSHPPAPPPPLVRIRAFSPADSPCLPLVDCGPPPPAGRPGQWVERHHAGGQVDG